MKTRLAPQPLNVIAVLGQQRGVRAGCLRDAFFAVMEYVDVQGETRTVLVERGRAAT